MALEVKEAGDFADHDILRADSVFRSQVQVVSRLQIGLEIEARKNAAVELRRADPGAEILVAHGICDDDKMMGETPGKAFGVFEKEIGSPALEIPERGSVNGMNDTGNARHPGRKSTHQTGLAAMRMHNIGTSLAEALSEREQRPKIVPWANWPDQMRLQVKETLHCPCLRLQGSFGAGRWTGDQPDLYARDIVQPQDGGEGILLSSADDEAGNNVLNSHLPAGAGKADSG